MRKYKKISMALLLASIVCLSGCQAQKGETQTNDASDSIATPVQTTPMAEETTPMESSSSESVPVQSSLSESTPAQTTPAAQTSESAAESIAETEPVSTAPSSVSTTESPAETSAAAVPASNLVSRTDGSALSADASMTYPIINVGSDTLNAAINNDIVAQNTALLQTYAASYSDVRLNYQTAFLDSKNVLYTSYYMDYTQPGNTKSNTFMFTRIYDLKRGGAAVRVTDLTYSARELAHALLTQDLDTYANTSLDPNIWAAQKAIILSQSEDALTNQLEKADFGSNNPSATIFTRKPADGLMTIYYPVGASLGDYAAFTVKVYE
ncbi:MAG TPA: hypothetical protein IAC96_10885 [Candidatus Fimimorpha faecalis]|uniref:DUF3298 domain-containing protein n=1 Tax=Candidatus Fimimorpha faecalis TaxID=2840824 RepID=A0A9D1JE61_9FIRM|nr:hypothetical protein [Candidatus Fimimorpha faecalis]